MSGCWVWLLSTWRKLPCEVFLGSHGIFFGMKEKRAALEAGNPLAFVDPAGCKAWFDRGYAAFHAELAKQQGDANSTR